MFKRKQEYLMQLHVDVNYPLSELREENSEFAAMPEHDLRALLLESLVRQVGGIARDVLRDHRQRWIRSDVETQGDGGEYATFSAYFKGDVEGGTAAFERWASRVESMGGVSRIGHASLRGSDETNLHYFDKEIEETYGSLNEETLARIDQLFEDRAQARESG